MNKKPYKVIMLPTEKAEHSIIKKHTDKLFFQPKDKVFSGTKQHLYILSDDKFEEKDWIACHRGVKTASPKIVDAQGHRDRVEWKKVIATTDELNQHYINKALGVYQILPQIPESFIKDYVKEGGIDEVYLEWDVFEGRYSYDMGGNIWIPSHYKLKLINNTVIIKVI